MRNAASEVAVGNQPAGPGFMLRLAGGFVVGALMLMTGVADAAPDFAPLPAAVAERGVPAIRNFEPTAYGGGS